MPRVCTVCSHPQRDEIDRALASGQTIRRLAPLYGVSESAISRHKRNHLPVAIARAREVTEVANAKDMLDQVRGLEAKARSILAQAEAAGDLRVALSAIREARGCLELLARLTGELQEGQTVNVLVLPEWASIRSALLQALTPYPEARVATARALQRIDGKRTG
jgi:hypothetical protein